MVARTLNRPGLTCWCVPVFRFTSSMAGWGCWPTCWTCWRGCWTCWCCWLLRYRCIEHRRRAACSTSPGLLAATKGSGIALTVNRSSGFRSATFRSYQIKTIEYLIRPSSRIYLLVDLFYWRWHSDLADCDPAGCSNGCCDDGAGGCHDRCSCCHRGRGRCQSRCCCCCYCSGCSGVAAAAAAVAAVAAVGGGGEG